MIKKQLIFARKRNMSTAVGSTVKASHVIHMLKHLLQFFIVPISKPNRKNCKPLINQSS